MSQYRIIVMVGSLRRDSYNRQLANAVTKLAPPEFTFQHARLDDIPLYNQDDDGNQPEPVKRLKAQISGAQAVMFVTPEYNRSVPGVLKNAIDCASRPYGQSAFTGKPAGIIGCSIGAPGSSMAQQHLRNILAYLDMPTLGQPEVFVHVKEGTFDQKGDLADGETREFLQGWMEQFVAWVKAHAEAAERARRA
ncbi:MAG TPA: NAD(P)H-dependent oxidoreductase [Vicinamibacterales bacterium]